MSFDEILRLTADVFYVFLFYNIYRYENTPYGKRHTSRTISTTPLCRLSEKKAYIHGNRFDTPDKSIQGIRQPRKQRRTLQLTLRQLAEGDVAQRLYLGTFLLGFFEMYYKMTGSSAKLDQSNTSFVGILLGQTPAIGGGGRYDCAACRDMKQTCREVARARRIETAFAARTLRQPTP